MSPYLLWLLRKWRRVEAYNLHDMSQSDFLRAMAADQKVDPRAVTK